MNLSASHKKTLILAAMLIVTLLWGFSFFLIKMSVAVVDVYYFIFLRFTLAFMILALIFPKRLLRVKKKDLLATGLLGLFLAGCYFSQTEGLRLTSASNSAMITGLYLVLIPLFLAVFTKEKVRPLSALGAFVAFVGLYFLTQYSWTGINLGDVITLVAALSCVGHFILTGRLTHQHDMVTLVMFQCLLMSLASGAICLMRTQSTFSLSPLVISTVIYTAVFCTVFALLVQVAAQRVIDPTRTGIIFSLEAVFGTLFACLFGGERLTTLSILGAALMVLGMVISEGQIFFRKDESKG